MLSPIALKIRPAYEKVHFTTETGHDSPEGGVSIYLYYFFNLCAEVRCVVTGNAPADLLPQKETRYPSHRRIGGSQRPSGRVFKTSPSLGFDPRTFQLVASHYADWAMRPNTSCQQICISLRSEHDKRQTTSLKYQTFLAVARGGQFCLSVQRKVLLTS